MTSNTVSELECQLLLKAAKDLLAQGEHAQAAELLLRARERHSTMLQAHALIEHHGLQGAFTNMTGLNCAISEQDDIFGFFRSHPSSLNPLRDYFADGWRTLSELMVLLEQVERPLLATSSVLEFASGHGRFTRHLVKAVGAQKVTVSDIVGDAVAFAQSSFGVQGFVSASAPEQLRWPGQYDLVFVLSLFSHLPRATWGRWLRVLKDAVAPGGLLVFSTHGIKAAEFHHVGLDAEGFFFTPSSESQAIDGQEYGTTFTSPEFVAARVAEEWGPHSLVHQSMQHFWNHQDAYVLQKPRG
ncbi:class I SAM-dependent methyltransferase [Comamonas sp.]|uniref:class I SAM-dependent methyltransferase n=1 Tax=Comamonas sp. TaxID=34028 RepID=UPI002FC6A56D